MQWLIIVFTFPWIFARFRRLIPCEVLQLERQHESKKQVGDCQRQTFRLVLFLPPVMIIDSKGMPGMKNCCLLINKSYTVMSILNFMQPLKLNIFKSIICTIKYIVLSVLKISENVDRLRPILIQHKLNVFLNVRYEDDAEWWTVLAQASEGHISSHRGLFLTMMGC